jgi:hypothetical protein
MGLIRYIRKQMEVIFQILTSIEFFYRTLEQFINTICLQAQIHFSSNRNLSYGAYTGLCCPWISNHALKKEQKNLVGNKNLKFYFPLNQKLLTCRNLNIAATHISGSNSIDAQVICVLTCRCKGLGLVTFYIHSGSWAAHRAPLISCSRYRFRILKLQS